MHVIDDLNADIISAAEKLNTSQNSQTQGLQKFLARYLSVVAVKMDGSYFPEIHSVKCFHSKWLQWI